ncbi:MAG TPA: glycosyltransferase [Tepidisphaeraceae bacterium]|nr:glycosyltransferase [Tepidisphaeraceae bacterium]
MPHPRRHILFVIVGISAGTGTFCKSLGAGLRKLYGEQFKISLLTFRGDSKKPENAVHFDDTFVLGSEVHEDWRRLLDVPRGLVRLTHALHYINPDLIFTIGTFSNIVTSLAAEKVPVILSEHLNMTQRLRGSRFGSMTGWFMRRTYSDRLMVVASRELADDLRKHFGARRVNVIPNGIDASIIRNRATENINIPSSRYFISVGRLTEQKDVATSLRGFAIAKQSGLLEDFLIAGDGEQRAMLESLAKELGIASNVHFLGHCPNPYPLIKNARGLILSSIWEGFAYVPIEAMALSVPVISTACPSGPVEILGNGEFGLLVPPRNPQQLADAMRKLSTDGALHQHLVNKSLQRADELSVENMASQYRALFLSELNSAAQI